MGPGIAARLLTDRHRTRLATLTRTDPHLVAHDLADPTPEVAAALADAEVLFTCWGATPLSAEVLTAAPRLRAVVHAAGSVKHHITDACWERGIAVTSAAGANALPVAEFTLAAILFANKRVLHSADRYRALRTEHDWLAEFDGTGNYRRTVGIIGASRIGRRVIELLRPSIWTSCCTTRTWTSPRRRGSASGSPRSTSCARAARSSRCTRRSSPRRTI